MNKPIIIDGVDVSECAYFDYENDGYEDSCYIHDNECSAQFCYFKQLQRLKAENENLKSKQLSKNGFICDCEKLDKYKQALEDVRKIAIEPSKNIKIVYNRGYHIILEKILKKINEVLKDA